MGPGVRLPRWQVICDSPGPNQPDSRMCLRGGVGLIFSHTSQGPWALQTPIPTRPKSVKAISPAGPNLAKMTKPPLILYMGTPAIIQKDTLRPSFKDQLLTYA